MEDANPFEHIFWPVEANQETPSVESGDVRTGSTPGVSTHESATSTPSQIGATPAGRFSSRKRRRSARANLALLERHEWDQNNAYDEDPPTCLHYSIEWKVVVNKKLTSKDTEPDVVVTPGVYWEDCLKFRVERLLEQKMGWNHTARVEDINVVVSVNARSERDLTKRFEREIDWRMVEKRLIQWGDLFQDGKKLRVDTTFNYVERTQQSSSSSSKRRGTRASATQQMLRARDSEINAERESSGQHSLWPDVYRLMRCPGPPCALGPYCWRDPEGKKHYRLYPHHLRDIIKFAEDGNRLECQADVPESVQRELKAADRLKAEQKQAKTTATPLGTTPSSCRRSSCRRSSCRRRSCR